MKKLNNHLTMSELIENSIEQYFDDLEGEHPVNLYAFALSQFEKPLYKVVMRKTNGNISRAAVMLGINRLTLRTKLKKYGLVKNERKKN